MRHRLGVHMKWTKSERWTIEKKYTKQSESYLEVEEPDDRELGAHEQLSVRKISLSMISSLEFMKSCPKYG